MTLQDGMDRRVSWEFSITSKHLHQIRFRMMLTELRRGLMWVETYQSGHMEPEYQPRSAYRHILWLLGHTEVI